MEFLKRLFGIGAKPSAETPKVANIRPRKPEVDKLVDRMLTRAKQRKSQGLPSIDDSMRRTYWEGARPLVRVAGEVPVFALPREVRLPKPIPPDRKLEKLPENDAFAALGKGKEKPILEKVLILKMLDGRIVRRIREERVDAAGKKHKLFWTEVNNTRTPFNLHLDTQLPLYRVEELGRIEKGSAVVVCEGEPATDALMEHSIPAVGTLTGALGTPSLSALLPLRGFDIILWPDADGVGRRHMERIADRLGELGVKEIHWIDWPNAPSHGDAADVPGGKAELLALIDRATKVPGSGRKRADIGLTGTRFPFSPSVLRPAPSDNPTPLRLGAPSGRELVLQAAQVRKEMEALERRLDPKAPKTFENHVQTIQLQRRMEALLSMAIKRRYGVANSPVDSKPAAPPDKKQKSVPKSEPEEKSESKEWPHA